MTDSTEARTTEEPAKGLGQRLARPFVLLVWLAMTIAAHVFVARYASPIPFMDDMELVSAFLPGARVDWAFLWTQANEHRIVIPRLVYLAGLELTGDFRSGMYFQVWAQSLLALGLALFAGRLRGRPSFADAFFPLLLLHWGNAENFLLGMQITIAVPTVLTSVFVALALRRAGAPGHGSAIAMAACAFLLPLNGGFGLMQLPPLLAWMLGAFLVLRRSGVAEERATARVFFVGVLATVALVAWYFVGFYFPAHTQRSFDLLAVLRTAAQFLSLNLGPIAETWRLLAPAGVLGFGAVALILALRAWRERAERGRILAIVAGLSAATCIALAIGMARSPSGSSAGLANRYVILPVPFFVTAFLALCVYGPQRIARAAQGLACIALAVVLPHDFRYGAWRGGMHLGSAQRLEESVQNGMSYEQVIELNWSAFYPSPAGFGARLLQLRQAGFPPFDAAGTAVDWPESDPYFMFDPRPKAVVAARVGQPRRLKDHWALALAAENEIVLAPSPGAARLTAGFGLLPNTWNGSAPGGARTEGVRFRVEARGRAGEARVLFERELRPHAVPGDRGTQRLDVALPNEAGLELLLRMEAVEGPPDSLDVGYWCEVRAR